MAFSWVTLPDQKGHNRQSVARNTMTDRIDCSAIVFDFDGTLADSMPFLENIGVKVMVDFYGVKKADAVKKYRSTTGLPYEQQIEMSFPSDDRNEEAIAMFEKLKIERIFEQKLFPNAVKTLKEIDEMEIAIFVSSSTFQETIVEYFKRRDISHFFVEILGYRPGFEKGADHFNHIVEKHNIPLDELVFAGDSIKDYERSNGHCDFIALERMFTEEDFRKAGHQGPVVENLSMIPSLLSPISE